jgi:ribosomal-protein-alanine N-acetyltransferase
MTQDDVPEVSRLERRCFTNPWPLSAYRRELRLPEQNAYVVLRQYPDATNGSERNGSERNGSEHHGRGLGRLPLLSFARRADPAGPRVAGFAGMWHMFDEAHITTIGVEPEQRGRGLGELLFVALVDEAIRRGAAWLTLEVRISNDAAQALYQKYGFTVHGTRKRYYSDNNEDAYVMWSPSLHDEEYLALLDDLRGLVLARYPHAGLPPTMPSTGERAFHENRGAVT